LEKAIELNPDYAEKIRKMKAGEGISKLEDEGIPKASE
jgi:hypothetical protein